MKAMKAPDQLLGFTHLSGFDPEPIEFVDPEIQSLLERAQGSEVNRDRTSLFPLAAGTVGAALAEVKCKGTTAREFVAAAYAAAKLRTQPEGAETLEHQEQTKFRTGLEAFNVMHGTEGEVEQATRIPSCTAFRRQPTEQLDEVATERKPRRNRAKLQKRRDQFPLPDVCHPLGANLKLNAQMVHQVQGAGESFEALARALCHRSHATQVGRK